MPDEPDYDSVLARLQELASRLHEIPLEAMIKINHEKRARIVADPTIDSMFDLLKLQHEVRLLLAYASFRQLVINERLDRT